jgi:peptidyl-dipeptidase Dcp
MLIHYKTKEVIPQELIHKIKKAETFNKGMTTELGSSNLRYELAYCFKRSRFQTDFSFENKH